MGEEMKKSFNLYIITGALLLSVIRTHATQFEPLGNAIAKALKTKKVFQKKVKVGKENVTVYFSKKRNGKARRYAVVREGVYPPNCTHTWVFGLDAARAKIEQVRVVEMSCPHAFPTKKSSFLDQFKGKGPAHLKKLEKSVVTVAKATGSSELTRDAAIVAIQAAKKLKGR